MEIFIIACIMFSLLLVILLALRTRHRAIDAEWKDEERKRKFAIWYLDKQVEQARQVRQLSNARVQAQQLAKETGKPYVTIEWLDKVNDFPPINAYDVMPLVEANKKLRQLDSKANAESDVILKQSPHGYYEVNCHIDYVREGKLNSFENLIYFIGMEGCDLIYLIESLVRNSPNLNYNELKVELDYLKRYS